MEGEGKGKGEGEGEGEGVMVTTDSRWIIDLGRMKDLEFLVASG